MSKPNSQTTQRKPLTKEDFEKMKEIPCRNFQKGECTFGNKCHYSHKIGGRVIMHDPVSHRRVQPPPQEKTLNEADMIAKIRNSEQCGAFSKSILKNPPTFDSVKKIIESRETLEALTSEIDKDSSLEALTSEIDKDSLVKALNDIRSVFPESRTVQNTIAENLPKITSENSSSMLKDFIEFLRLPSEAEALFAESSESASSYASALKTDPLEVSRRNPDRRPTDEFLNHISDVCGLSGNQGFKQMLESHNLLGKASPFMVSHFLDILAIHEATKTAENLLTAKRHQEVIKTQMAEAKVALLRECLTSSNPHLKMSFAILQNLHEFTKFVKHLTQENKQVLVSVFSPFMAYLSQTFSRSQDSVPVTCDFLVKTFESYSSSRKIDEESTSFKEKFFNIAKTPLFDELLSILKTQTNSMHGQKTKITVQEIFKYCLKELLNVYLDKVPRENLDSFLQDIVKHLLPFMLVISLRPDKANMLSGRWNKGYVKDGKQTGVYAFTEMQDTNSKKSILYWLMTHINQQQKKSKAKTAILCDSFEKLSNQFRKKVDESSDQTEFSTELLFTALDEIFVNSFLNSLEFGLKKDSINLGMIFKVEDNSISLVDSFPQELLMGLYYSFGSDESDPKTRQFSDVKALFTKSAEEILSVVEACQAFDENEREKSVKVILGMMKITPNLSVEKSVEHFISIMSSNPSEDILRRAYDIMSLGTILVDIHKNNSYFLSVIDALVIVLLMENFKNVKQFDIMNEVYEAKIRAGFRIFFPIVRTESLESTNPQIKQRLTELLGESIHTDKKNLTIVKKLVSDMSEILCRNELTDDSFHEQFKRFLPFLLNKVSLAALLKNIPEFELKGSNSFEEHGCSAILIDQIDKLFKNELTKFITSKNSQIQKDLSTRMAEISQISCLSEKLRALRFTKHISAIISLLNNLFSSLGLSYSLTYDNLIKRFPDTRYVKNHATLVADHVISVVGDDDETIKKVVLTAISAIYRVELPRNEVVSKEKKVETITLEKLMTLLCGSKDLVDLFTKCLPYSKSPLVRDLILPILHHCYQAGNLVVFELYKHVQLFCVEFNPKETSGYDSMFSVLKGNETPLSKGGDYNTSDDDFFQQIRNSLEESPDWKMDASVEVSKPTKRSAFRIVRTYRPVDSGMASGGGPAPETEQVSESDDDDEIPEENEFSNDTLLEFLSNDNKTGAVQYLDQFDNLDETYSAVRKYLENEESSCQDAIDALNQ